MCEGVTGISGAQSGTTSIGVYEDNNGAIYLAKNPLSSSNT